jgi:hypothetical protein
VAVKLAVSLEQVMVFGYERRVANPFPVLVFFACDAHAYESFLQNRYSILGATICHSAAPFCSTERLGSVAASCMVGQQNICRKNSASPCAIGMLSRGFRYRCLNAPMLLIFVQGDGSHIQCRQGGDSDPASQRNSQ